MPPPEAVSWEPAALVCKATQQLVEHVEEAVFSKPRLKVILQACTGAEDRPQRRCGGPSPAFWPGGAHQT
eukprot:1162150-Pelagomonas_calceolata.AAC.17